MRLRGKILDIISVLLFSLLFGCYPRPIYSPPKIDSYGCPQPPTYVFTKAGIDLHFAQSTFGKIVTGDINIKSNPQIISLASKAVTDERIRDYLRCLAIQRDGYTKTQAVYFQNLSAFMATEPTSQEFLNWQKINSFPSASNDLPEGFYYNPTNNDEEIEVTIKSVQTGRKWKIYTLQNARVSALNKVAVDLMGLKENLDTGGAIDFQIRYVLVDSKTDVYWSGYNKERFRKAFMIVKYNTDNFVGDYYTYDPNSTLSDAKVYSGIIFKLVPIDRYDLLNEIPPPEAAPPPSEPNNWPWTRWPRTR